MASPDYMQSHHPPMVRKFPHSSRNRAVQASTQTSAPFAAVRAARLCRVAGTCVCA
jgi:hypothetical protein